MLTVFLSSTSKDLTQCRESAFRAIEGLDGCHCVRMEDFGSSNQSPEDLCRTKVAECDVFVCIAGPLYGSRSKGGPSFTECEYNTAVEHKKPRLVFLTADDYRLAANLIEKDKERRSQLAFRKKLAKELTITRFSAPDRLSVLVAQAIRNWEARLAATGPLTQASLVASQINSVSYRAAVLNRSATLSDDHLREAVDALQKQVHRDFAPAWGIDAQLALVAKGSEPPSGSWLLEIEDESPYLAVSYHILSAEGLPLVKVALVNANRENRPWTMAASHELLETLADPGLNLTVFVAEGKNQAGRLFRRQICDPVSSPKLSYEIDGIIVSDFVYPAWFESFRRPESAQFDHGGHLTKPFEVAPGSYVNFCEVKESSGFRSHLEREKSTPAANHRKAAKKRKA